MHLAASHPIGPTSLQAQLLIDALVDILSCTLRDNDPTALLEPTQTSLTVYLLDNLRTSDNAGTHDQKQETRSSETRLSETRLAWPLRKDDTYSLRAAPVFEMKT
jgi:hypothetical protein